MTSKVQGYIIGALAAAAYGTNPLFSLPLYKEGLTPSAVLLYRYALALVMMTAVMIWQKIPFRLAPREIAPALVAGVLVGASSLFLFQSYLLMDAGIASSILFCYPVMVAVLMALLYHEKITVKTIASLLLAMTGIVLLNRSGSGKPISTPGFLLVIGSALTYAIYIILVNRPVLLKVNSITMVFYVLVCGAVLFAADLAFHGTLPLPQTPLGWSCIAGIAIFPTVLSFWGTTWAIRRAGSTPIAILGALEPVTAVAFGVTVFGEQLTLRILCGIALVIAAVLLIIFKTRPATGA